MSISGKHAYRFVYLKSDKWQAVRLEALVRANAKCRVCGEESIHNDAHHVYYPDSFWETTADCLIILCRPCHDLAHALISARKKSPDESVTEWEAIIAAIKEWRISKEEWLGKTIIPVTPPRLRKAYEQLHIEVMALKQQLDIPKALRPAKPIPEPHQKDPSGCKFCYTPNCVPRNMFSIYGTGVKQQMWWFVCESCFGRIVSEANIPVTFFSKGLFRKCIKAWKQSAFPKQLEQATHIE